MIELTSIIKNISQSYKKTKFISILGLFQKSAGDIPNPPNINFPSPQFFLSDCVHPNDIGYRLIMKHVLPLLFP
jgi:lysophospholipase L1-like esterase